MNKFFQGMLVVVVCLFCLNWGGTQKYSEGVAGEKPGLFQLKKGHRAFRCKISDGDKYKNVVVTRLCFKDSTYKDCARDEGDTYIQGSREDADIETKIDLNDVSSIEILDKDGSRLFVKEKGNNELFFRARVIFVTGAPPEEITINPKLAVAFHRKGVGDERAYLYRLDKIEEIMPDETAYGSADVAAKVAAEKAREAARAAEEAAKALGSR